MATSIGKMLERIDGLRGTRDLNSWEDEFVGSIYKKYFDAGKDTSVLSDKQVEKIEQIFDKHFA